MKTMTIYGFVLLLCLLTAASLFAQGKPYEGPDDPAGDIAEIREGYMTGNRVFLYFQNQCELSDYPRVDVSRWPNDYTGVKMTDGINLLVTAQVFLEDGNVPVTDPDRIATETLDTLWYCQTAFRGGLDVDPTGTIQWGLYPVKGYFNPMSEYPAMSNLPESWPPDGWPASGDEYKWAGQWNGRFGLGVIYADLETYFACNDAQDLEYISTFDSTGLAYFPRPGVHIGDKNPSVTIQRGEPWGGLGIRVETRGYQWNNPLARDAIFFEYNISNISDYDLPQVALGYHVDNAIGNDSNDEIGFFDTYLDLAFSWDIDGRGAGGLKTGTMGFAYLESPGLGYDGIDNDEDGLIDEKRDNLAGNFVGPTDGIDDVSKFLTYYKLAEDQLVDHWEGDEDQDWRDGDDADGDGFYSIDENAGDDVGLDGIGPAELNYPGPDQGECNHKPDFIEGFGCEPNFNATDVTESDMLGLTAFTLFHVQEQLDGKPKTFHQDWVMWQLTGTGMLKEYLGEISNLIEVFASGPFPLYQGRTERVSMSMLHSYDELSGLNATPPSAPVLFELKDIVRLIYEKDYRFAQPPKMPTLMATPADGKVILTWDDIADKATREPFLAGANDFEGYKLVRATDKKFQDAQVVTDGFGTPIGYKPIYQCDLKNEYSGFTDFGLLNGMGYYLGDNTGITHYYVDENVRNGVTYYYGLIAYDYGISDDIMPPGIAPSESNLVIELDEFENIRSIGQNIQIVTPHAIAPGYTSPQLEILANSIKESSGYVIPEIVAEKALKPDHTYTFKFTVDTLSNLRDDDAGVSFYPNGYVIYDVTDSNRIVSKENPDGFVMDNLVYDMVNFDDSDPNKKWFMKVGSEMTSDAADGVIMKMMSNYITTLHGDFDVLNSGWVGGSAPYCDVWTSSDALRYYPWDFEFIYTGDPNTYTGKSKAARNFRISYPDSTVRPDEDLQLAELSVPFMMINKTFQTVDGEFDTLDVMVLDVNESGAFEIVGDQIVFGSMDDRGRWYKSLFVFNFYEEPQPNDVYYATFNRPHFVTDSLTWRILPEGELNASAIDEEMENIKVVPNPYVATNDMEPVMQNWRRNQRRQIMFTHVPAQCTIKIFTSSGVFVDEIIVDNASDDGIAHWDVLTSESLEVAAGVYVYHVKSDVTGAEKLGKFAIIK